MSVHSLKIVYKKIFIIATISKEKFIKEGKFIYHINLYFKQNQVIIINTCKILLRTHKNDV